MSRLCRFPLPVGRGSRFVDADRGNRQGSHVSRRIREQRTNERTKEQVGREKRRQTEIKRERQRERERKRKRERERHVAKEAEEVTRCSKNRKRHDPRRSTLEHQSHRWPLSPSHTVRTNPRNVTSRLCSCVLPSSTRAYVAARQRGRTKTYEKPTIAGTTSENERQEGERGAPSDGERRPKTHTHTHTRTRTRINTRGARTRTDGRTDGWTVTERRGRGKKREREERETRAEADLSRFRRESNYFFFFFFIHPLPSRGRI